MSLGVKVSGMLFTTRRSVRRSLILSDCFSLVGICRRQTRDKRSHRQTKSSATFLCCTTNHPIVRESSGATERKDGFAGLQSLNGDGGDHGVAFCAVSTKASPCCWPEIQNIPDIIAAAWLPSCVSVQSARAVRESGRRQRRVAGCSTLLAVVDDGGRLRPPPPRPPPSAHLEVEALQMSRSCLSSDLDHQPI